MRCSTSVVVHCPLTAILFHFSFKYIFDSKMKKKTEMLFSIMTTYSNGPCMTDDRVILKYRARRVDLAHWCPPKYIIIVFFLYSPTNRYHCYHLSPNVGLLIILIYVCEIYFFEILSQTICHLKHRFIVPVWLVSNQFYILSTATRCLGRFTYRHNAKVSNRNEPLLQSRCINKYNNRFTDYSQTDIQCRLATTMNWTCCRPRLIQSKLCTPKTYKCLAPLLNR